MPAFSRGTNTGCCGRCCSRRQPELAIVFCRTKRGAEKVAKKLHFDGIECREIHGNLAQNKREKRDGRASAAGSFDVLVATDLASRGIDVLNITHIINYDIPEDPEAYVHRVGRTARMGADREGVTRFVTKEQGDELTKVENADQHGGAARPRSPEGWEPRPTPDDWTEGKPGDYRPTTPAKPIVNRYDRPYVANAGVTPPAEGEAAPPPKPAGPPRTIGSKIPVNRRRR